MQSSTQRVRPRLYPYPALLSAAGGPCRLLGAAIGARDGNHHDAVLAKYGKPAVTSASAAKLRLAAHRPGRHRRSAPSRVALKGRG